MKHPSDPTILLIDSDTRARKGLLNVLSDLDCCLLEASNGAKGLAMARTVKPTLVLTEICLPDIDGIDLISRIRVQQGSVVVVISGQSNPHSVIAALDAGADDFVTKPYSQGELAARIRVALRHAALERESTKPTFRVDDLEVDFRQRKVLVSGKRVHLTPLEYRTLSLLIENADRVMTYDSLIRELWESHKGRQLQNIRVLMANLRRKLESEAGGSRHLVTAAGEGYQFQLRGR
jgi:two-component system KDP operon response regulator KdpE